jgi:DNA-binding CsgD family transcriptional regulator
MKNTTVNEGAVAAARPQAVSSWLPVVIVLVTVIGFFLTLSGLTETANVAGKIAAFAVVPVAVGLCLLFIPFVQKRLFRQTPAETKTAEAEKRLSLTSREQEVLTGLLEGKAPKEIAYTLKISYPTVNFHTTNLYRKLEIHSRAELFAKFK